MEKPGILLVDDHQLFRSGLKYIIEETHKYEILGEASNGFELLNFLKVFSPQLVILDINMPMMDGIEASRQALLSFPDLNIMILSMHGETEYYNTLMDIGVKGFVLKDADNKEFLMAIERILQGRTYFSQELLMNIIKKKSQSEPAASITMREKEILELIARGYANHEISAKLSISARTVERHRTNLLEKTGSRNSVRLIIYALRHNLISTDIIDVGKHA
jgi:DNA-binding NarL/FixJ family response regulator